MGLVLYLFKAVRRKREIRNDSLNYIVGRDIDLAKSFCISRVPNFSDDENKNEGPNRPWEPRVARGRPKICKERGAWEEPDGVPDAASGWAVEEQVGSVFRRRRTSSTRRSRYMCTTL